MFRLVDYTNREVASEVNVGGKICPYIFTYLYFISIRLQCINVIFLLIVNYLSNTI